MRENGARPTSAAEWRAAESTFAAGLARQPRKEVLAIEQLAQARLGVDPGEQATGLRRPRRQRYVRPRQRGPSFFTSPRTVMWMRIDRDFRRWR